MRRCLLASLLLLTLSLLAASCTRQSTAPATGTASSEAASSLKKVGLLVTGPVSDGGWNEIAWKGCQQIQEQFGAEINHQLVSKPEQYESAFRGYGASGYDLVFGHGAEFSDAAMAAAPKFPKTRFVVTGGEVTGYSNAAHIRLGMEEGTYLLGLIAGSMTKTNKLGQIGGTQLEPVQRAFDAFEKGARAANPKAIVTTTYIGSWNDANAGKEQARALIQQGADFLFPNADAASHGVFQAVQESKAKEVLTFGANSDQTSLAPDVILANSVLDIPRAFVLVAESVRDGKFDGSPSILGMKEGVVSVVYNPALQQKIPAGLQQKVEAAKAEIIAGRLQLLGSGA
jgi:basic membrane lipoprotein Med (substrate-binding protein (PBP1-ABC) superfamily)